MSGHGNRTGQGQVESPGGGADADADEGFCVEDIGCGVLLDSRLAIIDQGKRWMALADLHYGYEVSRRAEGGLIPLWGMATLEKRVSDLLNDHRPDRLILVGDVVDSRMGHEAAADWLRSLGRRCDLICVRGNHDRGSVLDEVSFVDWHREGGFVFHHGDRGLAEFEGFPGKVEGEIEVVGHLHPAISIADGAGTVLRLPALVQEKSDAGGRWILPAFSPWAGGGRMDPSPGSRFFGCGGGRIIRPIK